MTVQEAIDILVGVIATNSEEENEALDMAIEALEGKDIDVPSRKGVFIPDITVEMFRNASLEGVEELMASGVMEDVSLPSAQPEPLTDKEQRIFLAAIGREMKVCEEVDRNYTREPYEDSLVRVCREIERKVKKALWMI